MFFNTKLTVYFENGGLDAAVKELPENYRTARRKLREEYQPQISKMNNDIIVLKGEIGDLKIALVETGVEVGPAIYLARIFETDVDTVVKFFIFVLIFVFDPMAVLFVISYNVTLLDDEEEEPIKKKEKNKKWWEVYGEKAERKKKEWKDNIKSTVSNDERFNAKVEDVKEEATIEGSTEDLEANLVDSPPAQRLEKGGFSRKIR